MTIHVLHAGDGYTYLTRQVAAGDESLRRGQELADYYTAEGNPPGRWLGTGLVDLGTSGRVHEHQMKALFGEGLHPDADRLIAERIAAGEDPRSAIKAARLGRTFPHYAAAAELHERWTAAVTAAVDAHTQAYGAQPDADQRRHIQQAVALELFVQTHGRAPTSDRELQRFANRAAAKPPQPVAGYDLVFTPTKSVSILWALGDHDVRRSVEAAHEAAWRDAFSYLEQQAARTRTGAGGIAQIDTRGLLAAAFDHGNSRLGDPNLHTHVALSTKVCGVDGEWRSLDGRVLHDLATAASEHYNTRIEDEMRRRLGVRFTDRPTRARPVREVDGIPHELIRAFSRRRTDIEDRYEQLVADYRERHGHEPPRNVQYDLAQRATLDTREAKKAPSQHAEQRARWRETAQRALPGCDLDALITETLHRPERTTKVDVEQVAAEVIAVVETTRATWNRWHVQAETERQLRPVTVVDRAARAHLVDAVTAKALADHSVSITAPATEELVDSLRRADGSSVFTVHGRGLHTSTRILGAEQELVDAARTQTVVGVSGEVFARVRSELEQRTGQRLTDGQVTLAEAFACGNQLLQVGIGPAGTGKTTAMRLAADAVRASGRRVIAVAPSAVAARALGAEIGAPAFTVHRLLGDIDRSGISPLRAGDVVLVDEAGMVDTLRLQALTRAAGDSGAVVRLLGDPRQLAAVEAGGALRLVASEMGAVRLDEVLRFDDPAEAAATLAVRAGDPAAIGFYANRDRIAAGSRGAMLESVYQAWRRDHSLGRRTVMIATTKADVTALATRARLDLIADGVVIADGVRLHDETAAGAGDLVVTRLNRRDLAVHRGADFVKNGDTWRVLLTHADGSLDVANWHHGGRRHLPAGYVAEHVELAYATTVHRVQGRTVDTSHSLIEPTAAREHLYVALTRGRKDNRVYVVTDPQLDVDVERPPSPSRDAVEVLTAVLRRSGEELSATQTIRHTLDESASLSRLVPEYLHAYAQLGGHERAETALLAVLGERVAATVSSDRAWPHLADTLAAAHASGFNLERVLERAYGGDPLSGARSPAAVLHSRVNGLLDRHARRTGTGTFPAWLPRPPVSKDGELSGWLAQRAQQIDSRIGDLVAIASTEQPAWLSPFGSASVSTDSWRGAVAAVVAYRDQYEIANPELLGRRPEPGTRQARAYDLTTAIVRRHREQPTSTALTPAQLRRQVQLLNPPRPTGPEQPKIGLRGPHL